MDKLLIIGDDLARDGDLARFVERHDLRLLTASDASSGLELLRSELPSVVLVAHPLGECSGVDVLKQAREAVATCEVVLVTSLGEMDVAIEALRAGALDYLSRPIDLDQLELALGRARERRKQRKTLEPSTILVLDDHGPTLKHVVQVLTKEGYRVLGAADGEEGMRLFAEKRIDVILADLRMPKKDGLAVLRETKGVGADVEVIVVTGHGGENDVVNALREGAINFLKKPVEIEQMLLAIEKALEHQALRRSLAYRNRDMELMEELVVRLTRKLELVVETPSSLNPKAFDFVKQLVDTLPFGVVVVGSDKRIIFTNEHVVQKTEPPPEQISAEWLAPMGVAGITEEELEAAFNQSIGSEPGTIETVMLSKWAFLVLTPLRLVRPDLTERYVALAIRGERNQKVV